jgi:hypothetical protein
MPFRLDRFRFNREANSYATVGSGGRRDVVEHPPRAARGVQRLAFARTFSRAVEHPGLSTRIALDEQREADGFFVLYELEQYETLTSKGYLDRLNAPTPWSTKMMPHHLSMVRSQCRVVASYGGGIAAAVATIRLAPHAGRETDLKTWLVDTLRELPVKAGLTGAHLLLTDTPKTSSPTAEQQIRGADAAADWIVMVSGYDPHEVERVIADQLSLPVLQRAGARENSVIGHYRLAFTMTPQDLATA